jgi:hypothetical protein
MQRVLIGKVIVDEIMAYDETYMSAIYDEMNNIQRTKQASWLRKNSIPLITYVGSDRNTMSVCHAYYAELSDIQATEFLLRF